MTNWKIVSQRPKGSFAYVYALLNRLSSLRKVLLISAFHHLFSTVVLCIVYSLSSCLLSSRTGVI